LRLRLEVGHFIYVAILIVGNPLANLPSVLAAALSRHTLYYHRGGTPQCRDLLVYERKDLSGWIINGGVTEDGRYLLVLMLEGSGNKNRLYAAALGNPKAPNLQAPIKPVIETDDAEFAPIGNQG